MGKRLSPSDTMFLYAESREQMMHVAGLMPFTLLIFLAWSLACGEHRVLPLPWQ